MKLVVEITLDSHYMRTANDANNAITKSVLKQASSIFGPLQSKEEGIVRDSHGNTVGTWKVT